MVRPITDEDRRRVRELHAAGKGRNAIARALGRSGQTISKLADELGLSFDRSAVVRATEAAKADAAAKRAALMHHYLDDAAKLRQRIWEARVYWDWGGKDHAYDEKHVDEPIPADQLKLMQASAMAADRSMKLELHDADKGAEDGKSMLGSLAAGLQAAYDQLTGGGSDEPSPAEEE